MTMESSMLVSNRLWFHSGDCLDVLQSPSFDEDSIDLVFTSPPYAGKRRQNYDTVAPDDYVDWFLPIAAHLYRLLKPQGSFVLNIKEGAAHGQRQTYVIDLILALRRQGWLWTEEFIWHKTNCYPGKWPNRFRDSYERLLLFNKQPDFKIRKHGLSNIIRGSTANRYQIHSAAFPLWLPKWFIDRFTDPGDLVLDPFLGSGTTCLAALELDRISIGIEKDQVIAERFWESLVQSRGLTVIE